MARTGKPETLSIEALHDLAHEKAEQWVREEFGSPAAPISRPDSEPEARDFSYSQESLDCIVGHLGELTRGTRSRVIDLLQEAADTYVAMRTISLFDKSIPPPSIQEKQFRSINQACKSLLKSLGLPTTKDVTVAGIPAHLRPVIGLAAAIDGVDSASRLMGIVRIAQMSNHLRQRARQRVQRERVRRTNGGDPLHQADKAFAQFLRTLMLAWYVVHGIVPGFSRPSGGGDAGGPFIRLVQNALAPLGEEKSGNAIAGVMVRLR